MFGQMQHEGVKPNHLTIVCALDACANLGALKESKEIHEAIANSGYVENVYVGNALVNMYGKCGLLDEARGIFSTMSQQNVASWNSLITICGQSGSMDETLSLFERMPERNVISWNAMIAAYVKNGQGNQAVDLFEKMELQGVRPNKITFTCLLAACANLATIEEGQKVHASIVAGNLEADLAVGNALLSMYGRCGSIESVKIVFSRMHHQDVVSWTAVIAGCAQCGESKAALELFSQMQDIWRKQKT